MEIKREKSECFSFVDCAFCFGGRNLEDIFEENESTSKYSTMIMNCFNIQIKRNSDDLKICEICIEQLSGALEFKHKLDRFNIAKQSTEKIYKDNCSSDYSNLKLEFVVKNEYMIDDCNDLESLEISDSESNKNLKTIVPIEFENDKNTKSSVSIDFQSDKSDSKTENPNKMPKRKSDKIQHPIKSQPAISNSFIPSLEPSDLICPVCKEEFNSHALLLQHHQNHYPNYICNDCGEIHVNKTSLINHLSKHNLKPYSCEYCKSSYDIKGSLRQHIRRKHKKISSYVCQLCPKRFSSFSARNKHRTEDHEIQSVRCVCPSCKKSYSTLGALSNHIRRVHQQINKFECTVCDKKFMKQSALDLHFVKHTVKRIFECNVCGKSYAKKKILTRHMKIHTNKSS